MDLSTILKQKGRSIISVDPLSKVEEVVKLLAEKRVGAVLIIDDAGKMLGILSERDIVRSLAANGERTLELTAAKLMTRSPIAATCETTIYDAEYLMTNGRFRHLPVTENGRVIGMVSIGDIVKAVLDIRTAEVAHMRDYVTGSTA